MILGYESPRTPNQKASTQPKAFTEIVERDGTPAKHIYIYTYIKHYGAKCEFSHARQAGHSNNRQGGAREDVFLFEGPVLVPREQRQTCKALVHSLGTTTHNNPTMLGTKLVIFVQLQGSSGKLQLRSKNGKFQRIQCTKSPKDKQVSNVSRKHACHEKLIGLCHENHQGADEPT